MLGRKMSRLEFEPLTASFHADVKLRAVAWVHYVDGLDHVEAGQMLRSQTGVAGPGGSQLRTRAWSSQPRTSGIGTAPAADSQFRPRASASTGLLGLLGWMGLLGLVGLMGLAGVVSLAKTSRPSVRVAR